MSYNEPVFKRKAFLREWFGKNSERKVLLFCVIIIALGCVFRFYKVSVTDYNVSMHDILSYAGMESEESGTGHAGYIEYICLNSALPDFSPTEMWAFYNPPFFHIVAAVFLSLFLKIGVPYASAFELIQYLPAFCMLFAVVAMYKILKELDIKGKPLVLMTAFLSFFPAVTYMGCTFNNDPMAFMFFVLAILYAIRWYKNSSIKNIVFEALFIGLGMMTKMTVALVAPAVGIVFIIKFFKEKDRWKKYLNQFAVFAAICFPTGLFWPIRNFLMFDIPFSYVQRLPDGCAQDVSAQSLIERIGITDISELMRVKSFWAPSGPYKSDGNIWTQTLRTALFDDNALKYESDFQIGASQFLMILGIFLAVLMTVLFVIGIIKAKNVAPAIKLLMLLTPAILLGYFIKFCFDYPFTCTMHFRYILPLMLFGAVGTALWWQRAKKNRVSAITKAALDVCIVSFTLVSVYLYQSCYF